MMAMTTLTATFGPIPATLRALTIAAPAHRRDSQSRQKCDDGPVKEISEN